MHGTEIQHHFFYLKADGFANAFPLFLRIMINCMLLVKITQEQDRILPLQIQPDCPYERR